MDLMVVLRFMAWGASGEAFFFPAPNGRCDAMPAFHAGLRFKGKMLPNRAFLPASFRYLR
jgi:hypothetical protein